MVPKGMGREGGVGVICPSELQEEEEKESAAGCWLHAQPRWAGWEAARDQSHPLARTGLPAKATGKWGRAQMYTAGARSQPQPADTNPVPDRRGDSVLTNPTDPVYIYTPYPYPSCLHGRSEQQSVSATRENANNTEVLKCFQMYIQGGATAFPGSACTTGCPSHPSNPAPPAAPRTGACTASLTLLRADQPGSCHLYLKPQQISSCPRSVHWSLPIPCQLGVKKIVQISLNARQ